MTKTATGLSLGTPGPLGSVCTEGGVNFALFSAHAERVDLCIFDTTGKKEIQRLPLPGRAGDIWHGHLDGAGDGQLYGYRVHGPYEPRRGHRFNPNKLLVDPYARSLTGRVIPHPSNYGYHAGGHHDADLSFDDSDNAAYVPKCRVIGPRVEAPVVHPRTALSDTVIYELHVRGFTKRHPNVPAKLRGTFAGLASPRMIDYLVKLGVTAIELLPAQAFADERHLTRNGLVNFWGYNPYNYFAVDPWYLASGRHDEARDAIAKLHAAGIEVLLDVVYNHTAEGDELGPTLSFRGIDNASYYRLAEDPRYYVNDSCCGNSLNVTHPQVKQMVLDSLAYWVDEMGIDGFRFDLGVSLGRDPADFNPQAALLDAIRTHPSLSEVKLIAEPWDCGHFGHQTGHFPPGWSEWNDFYRDTVRRVWRGDSGMLGDFATRLAGSGDLFVSGERGPLASVNYVAAHDGFTLDDLVSYAHKHNEANREHNRDGPSHEVSWNNRVEGPTDRPDIIELRARQKRSLLASLFLSQGIPMIVAGDEFGRAQDGNNNPYCQDNEIGWLDWARDEADLALTDFVTRLVRFRKAHAALRRERHFVGETVGDTSLKDITWLHPQGREMGDDDWLDHGLKSFGFLIAGEAGNVILVLMNPEHHRVAFRLPEALNQYSWRVEIDTAEPLKNVDTRPLNGDASIDLQPSQLIAATGRLR